MSTQEELNEALEAFFNAAISEVTTINNAYKNRIRRIQTRLVFKNSYSLLNGGSSWPYFQMKTINDAWDEPRIINGIKKCVIKKECDTVPVNTAVSSSLSVTLSGGDYSNITNYLIKGAVIRVDIGILLNNNTWFWHVLGTFRINECKKKVPNTYEIEAYDEMYFLNKKPHFANRTGNALELLDGNGSDGNRLEMQKLMHDETTRSQFESISITSNDITKLNECETEREALAYIAGKVGKYAHIVPQRRTAGIATFTTAALRIDSFVDAEGVYIANENYDTDPEYRIEFEQETEKVRINNISLGTSEDNTGHTGNSGTLYCFYNPLASSTVTSPAQDAILNIANSLPSSNGFSMAEYETGQLNTTGNPLWTLGQALYFYDAYGTLHRILICGIEMDIGAHLSMTITSKEPPTEFSK